MSKINGKKNSSKLSTIRLNRKNHRPEVVLVSSTNQRLKQPSDYRKLKRQPSDTTSLSDNNNNNNNNNNLSVPSKFQRFSSKESYQPKYESRHYSKHDEASVSSLNTIVDEMKALRQDSETLSLKLENRAEADSKHRMSILRHNWAKHSDVPFVIGAHIIENESDVCGKILLVMSWFFVVVFFPLSLFLIIKVVQEYEFLLMYHLKVNHLQYILTLVVSFFLNHTAPIWSFLILTDYLPTILDEVLTKDSVSVAVDAVVYYRVFNPVISISNVENSQESTRLLAQTSLRNVLGTISLAELLSNREAVSCRMREILDEATDHWGIKVERVEIKDVRLPKQLQRAMAAEAEASREARAKVIAAEGEHKAARALKDASDILSQSPCALQLRYLQTLNSIAAEKNSTIIFPLPIELLSSFMNLTTAKIQSLNINNNHDNIINQEVSKRVKHKVGLKDSTEL